MNRRQIAVVVALALLETGCLDLDELETADDESEIGVIRCPTWGCGSNGVVVFDYPVDALHLGGALNANGFRIAALDASGQITTGRPTLQWGPRGAIAGQAEFDVRNSEIFINDSQGWIHPLDSELRGAWFVLARGDQESTIHIVDVATVPSWIEGAPPVPVYDLRLDSVEGEYLCPEAMAWGEDWQTYTGPTEIGGRRVEPWERAGYYAMLIRGETYNGTDATVAFTGRSGKPWLNIACSGTALSKMRLFDYDPERPTTHRAATTWQQRQATLKMITAKYCGSRSYTTTGTPLWFANGEPINPAPDPKRIGPVEALWDADGALCLSHSRLYDGRVQKPTEPAYLTAVRDTCEVVGRRLPSCDRIGPVAHEWQTTTLDHVD